MNARQKAKKYKKLYEKLLNQSIKPKIEQHKIDTLRFEKFYPEKLIAKENSNTLQEIAINDITQGLAQALTDRFDNYIDYFTEYCSYINEYRFCGEIKVVEKK
jgi:hypothetical protein